MQVEDRDPEVHLEQESVVSEAVQEADEGRVVQQSPGPQDGGQPPLERWQLPEAERSYSYHPTCLTEGHVYDDGSLPTCTRPMCESGMEEVDAILAVEEAGCRCVETASGTDAQRCGWHNPRFHSMEGVEEYYRLLAEEESIAQRDTV